MLTDLWLRVVIGVIALAIGIGMILVAANKPAWFISGGWETFWIPGVLVTLWGIVWFGVHLINLVSYTQKYDSLVKIYETKQYEIVEGTVQVRSIQPKGGHAPGDMIQINGVQFEINYYSGRFGYNMSIAHNGVLTEGQYVKVYYYDGRILRIDLKQDDSTY